MHHKYWARDLWSLLTVKQKAHAAKNKNKDNNKILNKKTLLKNWEKMRNLPSEYFREKVSERETQQRNKIILWDPNHRIMCKSPPFHLRQYLWSDIAWK